MTTLNFGPNTVSFQRDDASDNTTIPLARLFLIGRAERGPVGVPTVVTDTEDFYTKFGQGSQANGTDRLAAELEAYRQRVGDSSDTIVLRLFEVAQGSTMADATAKDASTGKLKVVASSPGTWGNGLTRAIVAVDANNVELYVREVVNGVVRQEKVVAFPVTLEGVRTANAALAGVAQVNFDALASTTATSTTAPGAPLTWVPLAGGADSASISLDTLQGSVNADTQERTGLHTLRNTELGGGVILAEGAGSDEARRALYSFAAEYSRIYLDAPLADILPGAAETEKARLQLLSGADHAAYIYPRARDTRVAGAATRSALGWIAGEIVAGIMQAPGNIRPPAGRTLVPDVQRAPNGRDVLVHDNNAARLKKRGINVLVLRGGRVELEGMALMRPDLLQPATDKLYERMTMMALAYDIGPRLSRHNYVYIDARGAFFNVVRGAVRDILKPYYLNGVLFGNTLDDAFNVKIDFDLNPPAQLQNTGRAKVRVKVKISPVSEGLDLAIFHIPLSGTF